MDTLPGYSVRIKHNGREDRLILERCSDWLLTDPPSGSIAVFPLSSELEAYGSVIEFYLESGTWKYGEWNKVRRALIIAR